MNKKLIIGTLLAIAILGCFAISMEIIGNISEQAEISGYTSGQVLNSPDGANPNIILNPKFTEERTTVPLYDVKFEKLNPEEIKKVAESFNITGDLENYIINTGEIQIIDNSYDPQRQFSYYSKSGSIVYTIPDKEFPNSVEVQPVLPSEEEAIKIANEFLEKTGTYQKEAFVKTVEVNQKQQVWKSGAFDPEKSYDVTIAVRYARNLDGILVYGDELSVIIGDGGEVVGLVKTWREVKPAGTVQLRTAEDAYEDLCNQKTIIPVNFAEFDTITISDISPGYWMEPRIYEQNKVVPIYVFSGTAKRGEITDPFIGYVYALESSQIPSDETDIIPETGKPCTSNEEWHQKADQTGFWADGILVDEIISNNEILGVLNSYGIEDNKKVKIYDSGWDAGIGYYIEANESQFREIQTNVEAEKYTWNLSFNSPGFDFISPSSKKKADMILSPVFLLNSGNMSRKQICQNLISRGINVNKAKVVYFNIFDDYSPEEREQLLSKLNNDSHILFAFKEYMNGDIC